MKVKNKLKDTLFMEKIRNIYYILATPFTKHISLFLILFVLLGFNDIYRYITIYNAPTYSVYLALKGFLLSYVITFILSLLPSLVRKMVSILFVVFFAIYFAVEFYCIDYLGVPFDADFATMIFTTNTNEASEFFQSMVPFSFIIKLSLLVISVILCCYVGEKIVKKLIALPMIAILVVAVLGSIHNTSIWDSTIFEKVYNIAKYEVPSDLRVYFTHPKMEKSPNSPQNIVVIMGESFSRHHSSIYGYEKNTNPLLSKLVEDSSLIVFNNATSAGLSTMISFKYMMSGYGPDSKDDKEWNEYPLLLDVVESAGYNTHWFSNHANVGVNNNVTRLLAFACKDNHFTDDNISGDFSTTYDELLIDIAKPYIAQFDKNKYNFYFFHLLGSHFKFDLRYPKDFAVFSEKDYLNNLEHQRFTLASYDNSILYNDKVVYDIIQLFKDKDAIVVYLADHGLDIYNTSDNYAAHGKINDPISAKYGSEIPFFIYPTELYKQNNPDVVSELKESRNQSIRTDSLMNIIMNIAKIRYKEDVVVKNKKTTD